MQFGTDTYRLGALERLEDARVLLEAGRWVGSIYSAGVAVEGMLRALHWIREKKFEERHSLRDFAVRIRELGLLRSGENDADFVAIVQGVGRCWQNALRYADSGQAMRWLLKSQTIRREEQGGLKQLGREHFHRCSNVIKRCEVLWNRNWKNKG